MTPPRRSTAKLGKMHPNSGKISSATDFPLLKTIKRDMRKSKRKKMPDGLSQFSPRKSLLKPRAGASDAVVQNNQRLFREERNALASKHPRLELQLLGPGASINRHIGLKREAAVAMGVFVLDVPDTTENTNIRSLSSSQTITPSTHHGCTLTMKNFQST